MFYVLVKFKGQTPVVFGTTNTGYASKLATMDDVEWVSANINSKGAALGKAVHGMLSDRIPGIEPPTAEDKVVFA